MLGDAVEKMLTSVGVTGERVEHWLGRPCGCQERKQKLNALGHWAARQWVGREKDARKFLRRIMGESIE